MGKKGKRGDKPAEKKALLKRLDALAKKLEEELKGADLFAPPPPIDDCPICLVRLPRFNFARVYQGCCGKTICQPCFKGNERIIKKMNSQVKGNNAKKKIDNVCPFCREPEPTGEEYHRQLEVKALQGDAFACNLLGAHYEFHEDETLHDSIRALQYYIQATELGSGEACGIIALSFKEGKFGVPVDKIAARLFYAVAALRGNLQARRNIGRIEYGLGNHELGIRQWKISANAGYQDSLNRLRDIFNADGKLPGKEFISKEELDTLYRACHESQEEVKTDEREKYFQGDEAWKC